MNKDTKEKNIDEEDYIDEEILEEDFVGEDLSFFKKTPVKIFFALILIISLIYISTGIREYFFYRRTPISVQFQPSGMVVDEEEIVVPVSVFVIRENRFKSARTDEEVDHILENGFRFFEEANISFSTRRIVDLYIESDNFLTNHSAFLKSVDDYDRQKINIFLTGHLDGNNGIAFMGLNSLAVADYVTAHDYRTLAHEIGHILGLGHSNHPASVMYQASYGTRFSLDEIEKMRRYARKIEISR